MPFVVLYGRRTSFGEKRIFIKPLFVYLISEDINLQRYVLFQGFGFSLCDYNPLNSYVQTGLKTVYFLCNRVFLQKQQTRNKRFQLINNLKILNSGQLKPRFLDRFLFNNYYLLVKFRVLFIQLFCYFRYQCNDTGNDVIFGNRYRTLYVAFIFFNQILISISYHHKQLYNVNCKVMRKFVFQKKKKKKKKKIGKAHV
eukprot:TRINITY_DN45105_c0_g1_i2.p1 TRINITY_DN45105_c0_g1~~TRINITY_DN45105_c0_g1_i2.p1  ORF type:complete len:198 (-),score=-3.49 TRINITY_DN45105_c0_g1_i2:41-634(-)